MIAELLGDLFTAIGGHLGGSQGLRSVARRARRVGDVLGAARVRSGEVPSLSDTWQTSVMHASAGTLSIDGTEFPVSAAARRTGDLEFEDLAGNPMPDPAIIDLSCLGAQVELTVMAEDADRIATALSGQ